MATERVRRKLSAILSADVAGYSRLMEDDETATVQMLESYQETVASLVQQYSGHIVDYPGDNTLAEFASVVDAVQCAVEIQQVIKARNADLPEDRKMEFRIGVNLGDVIEEREKIYGEGVNIAARIEALADPGGICISGSAYEQIETKLRLGYENLGAHKLKNISKPIRIYRIPMGSRTAAGTEMGEWVPALPTIAVLPFANMSSDPEQQYFGSGVAEDILNGLAKNPKLIVRPQASSSSANIEGQDAVAIGKILNVTYLLRGSARTSGDRIRVTAQLIDAERDAHIWSERYSRVLTDVFAVQDEIAEAVLGALNAHLIDTEGEKAPGAHMEAHEAYQLGRRYIATGTAAALSEAVDCFLRAIDLDKDFVLPYEGLAEAARLGRASGIGKTESSEIEPRIILQDISNRIYEVRNLSEIPNSIWDGITTLFGAEAIVVYMVDGSARELVVRSSTVLEIRGHRIPISVRNIAGYAAFKQRLINIRDAYDREETRQIDPQLRPDRDFDERSALRTRQSLAYPIIFQKYLLGAVQLINRRNGGKFAETDELAMKELAKILGIAIYNQRRLARARNSGVFWGILSPSRSDST